MTKRERTRKVWPKDKGQTTQWPKEKGQTIQWPKEKGQEKFEDTKGGNQKS